MRMYSFDPYYLRKKDLGGVWFEGVTIGQKGLLGEAGNYNHHSGLIRFRETDNPIKYLSAYLWYIYFDSQERGLNYNKGLIKWPFDPSLRMTVTHGQLEYEWKLYLQKTRERDFDYYQTISDILIPASHSMFKVVSGPIENWERVKEDITNA